VSAESVGGAASTVPPPSPCLAVDVAAAPSAGAVQLARKLASFLPIFL
jgi:hypothetical protein